VKKTDPQQGAGCANCRFWKDETQADDDFQWGYCRRYPPRSGHNDDGDDIVVWSMTVPENWCGEWAPGHS
jgi:hypothetical protein